MNEMVDQSSITIDIDKTMRKQEEQQSLKGNNEFEKNIILAYQFRYNNNSNLISQNQTSNSSLDYLMSAHDSIAFLDKKFVINKNTLDKLSRMSSYGIYYQIVIGKIYIQIFEQNSLVSSLQGPFLITFLNQVLNLLETVRTTSIEYPLEKKANEFISAILTMTGVDQEQKESLKQFMSDKKSNPKHIQTQQINFSSFHNMMLSLNKAFEKIYSFEAQYELFIDNIDQFISLIQSVKSTDSDSCEEYIQFGDVLMTLLFTESAVVLYQTENEKEMTNTVQFHNYSEQDIPFIHRQTFSISSPNHISFLKEQMIPLALAFIRQFSTIEDLFEMQYICFLLLRRLCLLFSNYNPKFSSPLIEVVFHLCSFDTRQAEECRQLIRNIIEYSGTVQQFHDLKPLVIERKKEMIRIGKDNTQFNDDDFVLSEPFGVDGLLILDYDLKIGMFNYAEIQSGEMENIYIEINQPHSLVDFCVLINDLDITISFSYLMHYRHSKNNNMSNNDTQHEFIKIKQYDQVNIYDSPKKFLFFISSPGIIKVTFDNSYSWLKSKTVSYKSNVLAAVNPFDILRTIAIINFNILLSNQIDSSSFEKHSTKVIMYKLGTINKAFNAGKLLNNITKYNSLRHRNEINQTLPLFIKGNIIWEMGDSKNRRELTKESFDAFLEKHITDGNDKFTILHLFNMSNEDKATSGALADLLPFSLGDCSLGDQTIVLKSNFVHCCLILQIYYYVLDSKHVNDYLLFIHCGEFGIQLSGYQNGVIDYIIELNSVNDLTTFSQQSQLIADYYNAYDYLLREGKEKAKEVIEIFVSGIKEHSDELTNELRKAKWKSNIDVIINRKEDDFIKEVIQSSHFFLLSD